MKTILPFLLMVPASLILNSQLFILLRHTKMPHWLDGMVYCLTNGGVLNFGQATDLNCALKFYGK